jgi:23S rRNA (uracil-5-)-methyltransferase RumA
MATPFCSHFGVCGGCSLQDVDYPEQLSRKRLILKGIVGFEPQVYSGDERAYRCRMDFSFNREGVGFRTRGSWWQMFKVNECPISNRRLNDLLREVNEFFSDADAFDQRSQDGAFKYCVIRTPERTSSISFVLNKDSGALNKASSRIAEFASSSSCENIIQTLATAKMDMSVTDDYSVVKGADMLFEDVLGMRFYYHIQGFFQNNPAMNGMLHGFVRELIAKQDVSGSNLLDLYGGVGTFGIVNAGSFKQVYIVESDRHCIEAAEKNIRENTADNVSVLKMEDRHLGSAMLQEPLFAIIDPPRNGMHPKAIKALLKFRPKSIVYISCNPNRLRGDLKSLQGYEIKSVAMFDFFPQTSHMESVVELALER